MRPIRTFLLAVCSLAMVSCGVRPPSSHALLEQYNAYDRPASLPKQASKVRVKVSLDTCIAYVMEEDRPLLVMPVGVGKSQTPTPTGSFRITHKDAKRRAYSHGIAVRGNTIRRTWRKDVTAADDFIGTPMPYWSEFKSAYGFHTGWIHPYPSTHGCIRMHHNLAPKFFRIVPVGAPVHIARSQPEDATFGCEILANRPDATGLPDRPLQYYRTHQYFTDHLSPKFN